MLLVLKRSAFTLVALAVVAVVAVLVAGPALLENQQNKVVLQPLLSVAASTQKLHQTLVIADLHTDSLLWKRDLLQRSERGHVDVPRLQAGNVALQVFTTVTKSPAGLNYTRNSADSRDNITLLAMMQAWPMATWDNLTERALYQGEKLHELVARAPQQLMRIETQSDLAELLALRQQGSNIVGVMLGTEGSHALSGELGNIQHLADAGFRIMSLQHFFDNELGGSLHGTSKAGLTAFGAAAVAEMERLGIVIDVAHSSPQVVKDTLALVHRPIIVSHTGTYSHCPNQRNISDELMQKIAARGGLIGIGFWSEASCGISASDVAKAIVAAVALVGEDHIALGSDYDGSVTAGFDISQLAQLTQALLDQGMSETTIAKIMGGNQIRFLATYLPQ